MYLENSILKDSKVLVSVTSHEKTLKNGYGSLAKKESFCHTEFAKGRVCVKRLRRKRKC